MIYALSAMIIWATTAIQIRYIKSDIYTTMFWTNIIAIIPAIIVLFIKHRKTCIKTFIKNRYMLLSVGILALINGLTYLNSIRMTTIANALITHYTAPVMVAAAAPFILDEKFTLKTFFSLIIAFTGLLLIINLNKLSFSGSDFIGISYGLISAAAYAGVIIIGRKFKTAINPFIYIFSQSITAIILLSYKTDYAIMTFDNTTLTLIIIFGLFNIFIAAFLFFHSLTLIKAATVGIIGYIEPVGAILISVIFMNETLNARIITGGLLILLSPLVLNPKISFQVYKRKPVLCRQNSSRKD